MNHQNLIKKLRIAVKQEGLLTSLRQISLFSGGGMTAQLIMMVYALIVARSLGPEQLGVYNGMYAILGVSITLVNFGLDQWMLNEAHKYHSVQIVSGKIIIIKLILGLVWGLLCMIVLPLTRPNYFTVGLILFGVGDVISDVIFNSIVSSWSITRNIRDINLMLLLSRIGKFFLLVVLIFINYVYPMTIVGSRFFISFLVLVSSLLMFKPILSGQKIKDLARILKKSTDFGLSEVFAMIYANIDVAILSFYSITDTGMYSPASGIIHALFIIPNSIFIFLLPKYSKKINGQDKILFGSLSIKILSIFIISGFILFLSLYISGEFLVSFLLGANFIGTGQVLIILSPIMLFKSISFGLALLIIITGNQRKRLVTQLAVSIFNILFNLILIPLFGLTAVAWVYTISEFLLMLGYLVTVIQIRKNEQE